MPDIRTINSIEVSSLCDNCCEYCPAAMQHEHRKTGLMSMETFKQALRWVRHFARQGTQKELNLFGVGEPTLNPHLVEMVQLARTVLPARNCLHLNTNGNRMTRELAVALKQAGITSIDITGHDHRVTARTVQLFRELRIAHRVSHDFATAPNNWAGQVPGWFAPQYSYPCHWLGDGQVMVMSSGQVTACCLDAFGRGIFATVREDLASARSRPFSTCRHCHHIVPDYLRPQMPPERSEA